MLIPALKQIDTMIPDRHAICPTDRSISPMIRTKVIPIPTIATMEIWRAIFRRLSEDRKTGRANDIPTIMINRIRSIRYSPKMNVLLPYSFNYLIDSLKTSKFIQALFYSIYFIVLKCN